MYAQVWLQFEIHWYLYVLVFVVLDIGSVFLYPLEMSFIILEVFIFIEILMFVLILIVKESNLI